MNLDESFNEIAEYLSTDVKSLLDKYEQIKKKYPGFVKWCHISEEEWRSKKIDETNVNDVIKFYQETPNYMFELMEYHSTIGKQNLSKKVISIAQNNNFKTILDFGAGICQDSIEAKNSGLLATAADIPGKTFNFGKWRIKKRNLDIKFVNIIDEIPLKELYDSISCFEVLQHVVNPKNTLQHLFEHINPNGILFLTTRFKNNYELALQHNKKFENGLEELILLLGFEIEDTIRMWGERSKSKFLYILRKNK